MAAVTATVLGTGEGRREDDGSGWSLLRFVFEDLLIVY
jgi:hypothetical protein